jgi:Cdc6-like AAA superfamily ATPase
VIVDETSRDARRALNRLRRALEKAESELQAVAGSLRHAEGADYPQEAFAGAEASLQAVMRFVDEQEQRLQDKILHAGGLEPGRIRRGS